MTWGWDVGFAGSLAAVVWAVVGLAGVALAVVGLAGEGLSVCAVCVGTAVVFAGTGFLAGVVAAGLPALVEGVVVEAGAEPWAAALYA